MKLCAVFLVLGAILLVCYVREKLRAYSLRAVLLKTSVSVCFILTALCGAWQNLTPFSLWILGGLVFGLLGDIWLDLKYVYPSDNDRYTYAGFLSFAVGHVFYMIGVISAFATAAHLRCLVIGAVLGILGGFVAVFGAPLMHLDYGRFRAISCFYGVFLFSMLFLSGALAFAFRWQSSALNCMALGGALFAVSDLVLSRTYFGVGYDRPVDIISNYATYYPAQFLIALSILFV